jgi:hypothetical protein
MNLLITTTRLVVQWVVRVQLLRAMVHRGFAGRRGSNAIATAAVVARMVGVHLVRTVVVVGFLGGGGTASRHDHLLTWFQLAVRFTDEIPL